MRLLGEVPDETMLRLVKLLEGLPDEDVLDLVDALSRLSPTAARRATKLMSGVVRTVVPLAAACGVSARSCAATSSNGSRLRSARLTTTAPSLAATSVAASRARRGRVHAAGDVAAPRAGPARHGRSPRRGPAGPGNRSPR